MPTTNLDDFWKQFWQHLIHGLGYGGSAGVVASAEDMKNQTQIQSILNNAEQDPTKTQGQLAQSGLQLTPEQEKWLDNLIAQQNVESARDWEDYMSSNDLLRAANQLERLGLSSSGVLQTGGSAANGVAAADNVKSNVGLQRYSMRMSLAKQLLSMTSSMASAGIYGKALGAAKQASSVVTSAASHSAYGALSGIGKASDAGRSNFLNRPIEYEDNGDFWNY